MIKYILLPFSQREAIHKTIQDNLNSSRIFLYFYGSIDESTGVSWCSDSVKADPILRTAFSKVNSVVIELPSGTRSEWKGVSNHFYKIDKKIKLTALPTVIEVNGDGEIKRLVEGDCYNQEMVDGFIG